MNKYRAYIEKRIKDSLANMIFDWPIYVICYGPSRNYRTKYRGENEEVFDSGFCYITNDICNMVDNLRYDGLVDEITIKVIDKDEYGQLRENYL